LSKIIFPSSLTKIEKGSFSRCRELSDIIIGENSNLTSIGGEAFYDCSSLLEINLPNGINSLET
jgi:hypothetical protein